MIQLIRFRQSIQFPLYMIQQSNHNWNCGGCPDGTASDASEIESHFDLRFIAEMMSKLLWALCIYMI